MRTELVGYERDLADVFPWAVERVGDEDIAGPGFTDDYGITAIREDERGDVVALALLIVGPAKTFINVGSDQIVADGGGRPWSGTRRCGRKTGPSGWRRCGTCRPDRG